MRQACTRKASTAPAMMAANAMKLVILKVDMPDKPAGVSGPNFKNNFYHRVGLLQIGKQVNPAEQRR